MHKFLVIIEKAGENYSAYSPDLPGCVATGKTRAQTERNMYKAIGFHLEGMKAEGFRVPKPKASAQYIILP